MKKSQFCNPQTRQAPVAADEQDGLPGYHPKPDKNSQETAQAQQHTEEAQQQRAEENEAIRIAADEEGYKRGFEAGLEAARTAEPTPEEVAFLEEKEKERQAIIDKFHKAIKRLLVHRLLIALLWKHQLMRLLLNWHLNVLGKKLLKTLKLF